MPIGIIDVLQTGQATLDDFPGVNPKLRSAISRTLDNIIEGSNHKKSLEDTLIRLGIDSTTIQEMIKVGEDIFRLIDDEEFTSQYGWIEAKDKFWAYNLNSNLQTFGNHKTYNIVLDGLEKSYGRHLPRKSEVTDYIKRRIEVLRYQPGVIDHYQSHKNYIEPGEEQD